MNAAVTLREQGMTMHRHIFICGCPRSGTTMLADLLNLHPAVSIGIERYGNRLFEEPLTPDLYEAERYHDIRPGDTFYDSLEFSPSYAEKQPDYASLALVGDKIPLLFDHLDSIHANFPSAKVIFCLRNILDVASSYEARRNDLADHTWSDAQNGVQAVDDWNRSIRAYLKWREKLDIRLFDYDGYEKFGIRHMKAVIDWLGLDWSHKMRWNVAGTQKWGGELAAARHCRLSAEAVSAIAARANLPKYRQLRRESAAPN